MSSPWGRVTASDAVLNVVFVCNLLVRTNSLIFQSCAFFTCKTEEEHTSSGIFQSGSMSVEYPVSAPSNAPS